MASASLVLYGLRPLQDGCCCHNKSRMCFLGVLVSFSVILLQHSSVRIATGLADEDAIMDLDAEELESLVKSSLQEMEMWLGEEKALRKMEQEELRSRFGQKINAILDARAAAEAAGR